jgi:hypothetical protein
MKNRFYGDKKDYFKYGLLDILSSQYKSIGMNWYLTDDRHGNQQHGNDIGYLYNDRVNWRQYNPNIFDILKQRVEKKQRSIMYCKIDNVVEFTHEVIKQLPDSAELREYQKLRNDWHSKTKGDLARCDLVFFDPDIGVMDEEELPPGVIRGSEYATIEEINDYDWCDWIVIQFLKRNRRYDQLINNPITKSAREKNKKLIAFIAGPVAFLYVTHSIDFKLLLRVFKEWDTKISTQILIA